MFHKLLKDTPTAKSGDYIEVRVKEQKKHLIDNGIIEANGIEELPKPKEVSQPGAKVGSTADIIDNDEVLKDKKSK